VGTVLSAIVVVVGDHDRGIVRSSRSPMRASLRAGWVSARYSRAMDPYRDAELVCPACMRPLREFQRRLVCDACNGIMVSLADLAAAIEDLTSVAPTFEWEHEHESKRRCPRCSIGMIAGRITLHIEDDTEHPRPELDHCATHGVWFDHEKLAKVLEKVAGKGHGSKVVAKSIGRVGIDTNQAQWSAMFPYFGGRGGF
jgi:hypothetical protein